MTNGNGSAPVAEPGPGATPRPGEWARVLTLGLPPLRKLRGWSQGELARRSGLHRRTIWMLEQPIGEKPQPGPQTLKALARAFGYVHLSDLWAAVQGVVANDPGTPLMVGEQIRRLVQALFDCTPQQQQFIEGLILSWAAQQQAEALGEARLLDLQVILGRRQ